MWEQVPVMSCHVWKCPDATDVAKITFFFNENNIRSIEDWSLWRSVLAQSNSWKLTTINYFHHVNSRWITNTFNVVDYCTMLHVYRTLFIFVYNKSWHVKLWWELDNLFMIDSSQKVSRVTLYQISWTHFKAPKHGTPTRASRLISLSRSQFKGLIVK